MNLNDCPVPVYGDTAWRGKCPSESVEQITFFNRLRLTKWGALAIHPRNEGKRTHGQVRLHKAEGLAPGASDIIIPARIAFVCELKRRDRTKSQWQPGQLEYLDAAQAAGAFACVALGCNAAWEAFEEWQKSRA